MATTTSIPRRMLAFEADGADWIVRLDCGHQRHIRHRPPLAAYPWLADPVARASRTGERIECDRCARLELPEGVAAYKTTDVFDELTLPAGLRREHTTRAGVWGRIEVLAGRVLLVTPTLGRDDVIAADGYGVVAPEIAHRVELLGPMRLQVVFLRVP